MDIAIDRVDTRAKLKPRRHPYWKRISATRYVGFRKLTKSSVGNWLARYFDGAGGYPQKPLGPFIELPEKEKFDAAKKAAEEWFRHLDLGGTTEVVTVRGACERYLANLGEDPDKAASIKDAEGRFRRHVYDDPIAKLELRKATSSHFQGWRARMLQKRDNAKASFNRDVTPLRAALNLALENSLVGTNIAWAKHLKSFENVKGKRKLYLNRSDRALLLSKCPDEAKPYVTLLMSIPMRPGDAAKLKVSYLDIDQRSLVIPKGKTGERTIPLPSDVVATLQRFAKNKLPDAWLVSRTTGEPWNKNTWREAINDAVKAAGLPNATCAYTLRHSTITDLVKDGLDIFHVAKLAGTSVAMIEQTYGHVAADHARNALQKLTL